MVRRYLGLAVFLASPCFMSCRQATPPAVAEDPALAFAIAQSQTALAAIGCPPAAISVSLADSSDALDRLQAAGLAAPSHPEAFAIVPSEYGARVYGYDGAGALYGAQEVAEALRETRDCKLAALTPRARTPAVPIRGANLFLVLPGKNEADWWFNDLGFWREYLDLLARARINFLDLHGMYSLESTIFPNALLRFATSKSFPDVGVPREEREANLAMLNTVIDLARERGIRVGLMSYRSDLSLDGVAPPAAPLDEAQVSTYVAEAAEDLARRAPGLWRLGFRIGESGHPASWYNDTFVAGVRAAGTGVHIYTRSWLTNRRDVLTVGQAAGDDFLLEVKYNGEHLATPYLIAGGAFADWQSYSYEDYLSGPLAYRPLFQVRAGGTHRIFRHASFERVRRMVPSFGLAGAAGFTLEATHAYFPQRDYYHSKNDKYSEWTFRRDELQYLLFGRLAYDPATEESVFRAALRARAGTDALWEPLQAASEIVPWIQASHTCGADHRDFAPDLEWGGSIGSFALPSAVARNTDPSLSYCASYHGPFDTFSIAGPDQTARDLIADRGTAEVPSTEVARLVLDAAARARAAAGVAIDPQNPEARDVQRECVALADLGEYFGHKLRGATALAVFMNGGSDDYLAAARAESDSAGAAWRALAADTSYIAPFNDELRMTHFGMRPFHWRKLLPAVARDAASIDLIEANVRAAPPPPVRALPAAADWLAAPREEGPGLAALTVDPQDPRAAEWTVTAELRRPPPDGAAVRILWKRFDAVRANQWQAVPARGSGTRWQATIRRGAGAGGFFAVEIQGASGIGRRYPDVLTATPYLVLEP